MTINQKKKWLSIERLPLQSLLNECHKSNHFAILANSARLMDENSFFLHCFNHCIPEPYLRNRFGIKSTKNKYIVAEKPVFFDFLNENYPKIS